MNLKPRKIFVNTHYDVRNQEILQEVNAGPGLDVCGEILRLREEGVRNALIKMGWTPPKE